MRGRPIRDHIARAYHYIPEAVCAIGPYWRHHAAARRTEPRRRCQPATAVGRR